MPRTTPPRFTERGGIVGMFALALMEREGPVYGYRIAERISEKTEGSWRPGAGAIYPPLQRLVARKVARSRKEGARTIYEITPQGRDLLRRIRERMAEHGKLGPDRGILMAEVLGVEDVGGFLTDRLERDLNAVARHLERKSTPPSDRKALAARLERLLRQAADDLVTRFGAPSSAALGA
jgi:DNA-binding PadR family transcriptional regulator